MDMPPSEPRHHQPDAGRLLATVRPMQVGLSEAREIDQAFNGDAAARWRLADTNNPRGDESAMFRPDESAYETVTNPEGLEVRRRLMPEEQQRRRLKTITATMAQDNKVTFDDLAPHRIRVCWRVVREIARVLGLTPGGEFLRDGLTARVDGTDPWREPTQYERPSNPKVAVTHPWEVVQILQQAELLPDEFQHHSRRGDLMVPMPGLSPLPPDVPSSMTDANGDAVPEYDPERDLLLLAYIELVNRVATRLELRIGSVADPNEGRYGLAGVTDPQWVRLVFPSRHELMAWEQVLTDEMLTLMVEQGSNKARAVMQRKYGYTFTELNMVQSLAIRQARILNSGDPEDAKALMLMQLDAYIRKAGDALDLRNELAGHKQKALIMGLGQRTEQKDSFEDMLRAVRKSATKRIVKDAMGLPEPPKPVPNEARRLPS